MGSQGALGAITEPNELQIISSAGTWTAGSHYGQGGYMSLDNNTLSNGIYLGNGSGAGYSTVNDVVEVNTKYNDGSGRTMAIKIGSTPIEVKITCRAPDTSRRLAIGDSQNAKNGVFGDYWSANEATTFTCQLKGTSTGKIYYIGGVADDRNTSASDYRIIKIEFTPITKWAAPTFSISNNTLTITNPNGAVGETFYIADLMKTAALVNGNQTGSFNTASKSDISLPYGHYTGKSLQARVVEILNDNVGGIIVGERTSDIAEGDVYSNPGKPTLVQNGNNVTITLQYRTTLPGYNSSTDNYIRNYIEYYYNSWGNGTVQQPGNPCTLTNPGTIAVKQIVESRTGTGSTYTGSEVVNFTPYSAPTVAIDETTGAVSVPGYNSAFTYYYNYTTDGTEPTAPNSSSTVLTNPKTFDPGNYKFKFVAIGTIDGISITTPVQELNVTVASVEATLTTLPGSWKWEANGTHNFGISGTTYKTDAVIDIKSDDSSKGYLEIKGGTNTKYYEVNSNGELSIDAGNQHKQYITFIVPGPGKIRVKAKRNSGSIYYSYGNTRIRYDSGSNQYVADTTTPVTGTEDYIAAGRIGGSGDVDMFLDKDITANGATRVYIWANQNVSFQEIEYINLELVTIPGHYVWSKTNGKFGTVGTTYTTDKESENFFIDNNHLLYNVRFKNKSHGNIIVTDEGLKFDVPRGQGVCFKVPGAGVLKVKGSMKSNDGWLKISSEPEGNGTVYFQKQRWALSASGYTCEYTGDSEAYVWISLSNTDVKGYIEEIEWMPTVRGLDTWGDGEQYTDQTTKVKSYRITDRENKTIEWHGAQCTSYIENIWGFNTGNYNSMTAINPMTNDGNKVYLGIQADADHTINVQETGFTFNQTSGDGGGYLVFKTKTPGIIEIEAEGTTDDIPTNEQIGDDRTVNLGFWNNWKEFTKADFANARAGDKLRFYVTVQDDAVDGNGNPITGGGRLVQFKKNWQQFLDENGQTNNWNDAYTVRFHQGTGWYEFTIPQAMLDEINGTNGKTGLADGQYVQMQGVGGEFSRVYLVKSGNNASRVSLSVGYMPNESWEYVGRTKDNLIKRSVYTGYLGTDGARRVFIGATAGTKIKHIRWTPCIPTVDEKLPVVTTTKTTWNRDNNFGGFIYNPVGQGDTRIEYNQLNPGTSEVPANSFIIYNHDGDKGYFTELSQNLVFTNSSTGTESIETSDRIVGIKVNGKGVLRVTCASIGPTSRTVRVSTKLSDLENTTITAENHSAKDQNDAETANDGEHDFVLARNQHNSYHEFYCYYDGEEGVDQMLYIWCGGASYKEFTWMPGETIMSATGQLNPKADLTITEATLTNTNGTNSFIPAGQTVVPKTLEIFPDKQLKSGSTTEYEYRTQYIEFEATVDDNGLKVSDHNKAPIWTSSQEGRKDDKYNSLLSHTANETTAFKEEYRGEKNPATSMAHRVTIANRTIKAGPSKTVDNLTLAALPEITDVPAFGIAYVVAGTTEGDQSDYRRLSLVGPASAIALDKTSMVMVEGRTAPLTALPTALYPDIDEWDNNLWNTSTKDFGAYGKLMPVKVGNAESTKWYVYKLNGNNEYEVSTDITVSANTLTNKGQNVDVTLTANSGVSGKYRVYAAISGYNLNKVFPVMEVTRNDGRSVDERNAKANEATEFVREWHVAYVDIDIKPSGIFLKRIVPNDNIKEETTPYGNEEIPTDVSVATPIVFEVVSSSIDITEDTKLPINVTPYMNGEWNDAWTVKEVQFKLVNKNGKTYLVYDLVDELQKQSYAENTPYQHLQYDNLHKVEFLRTYNGHDYSYQYDLLNGSESSTAYDFRFKTEEDKLGTTLETFIYNVSQRDNDVVSTDVAEKRLLQSHVWTNDWVNTESWFCNKRSYISLLNVDDNDDSKKFTTDDAVSVINAKAGCKIIIEPYNTALPLLDGTANETIKEKIKSIEINFNPANGEMVGEDAVVFTSKRNTAWNDGIPTVAEEPRTFRDIKAATGYTIHWEPTEPFRTATIEFKKNMVIDQIKIEYYSAILDEGWALKDFSTYDQTKFTENLGNGLSLPDSEGNTHMKMTFRQPDTRHFSILHHYPRGGENDIDRGEQTGDFNSEKFANSLAIRDDAAEPCEFYVFNTEDKNLAEITSIEFIYEKDNTNAAMNLFCVSDPRYNKNIKSDQFVGFVGYPLENIENYDPNTEENAALRAELTDARKGISPATDKYSGTDNGFHGFGKLVYRPESPTNYAAFALDCNEPGYIYIRKMIVRYDKRVRDEKKMYYLLSPTGKNFTSPQHITSVERKTSGIELMVPDENNNEAVAYTVKRTSTQNNLSSEVVMDETTGKTTSDNQKVTLDKLINGKNADFRHGKNYTVRMLNKDRMVIRQVGYRIKDSDKPKITLTTSEGTFENTDFRAEESLKSKEGNEIKIEVNNKDGHEPNETVIVWTKDGSAPKVEFSTDGRELVSIHGYVAVGSKTFDNDAVNALLAENPAHSDVENTIVLKALALPLPTTAPDFASCSDKDADEHTDTGDNSVVSKINKLAENNSSINESTYGQTSSITRANYILVESDKMYLTSARRGNDNTVIGEFPADEFTAQNNATVTMAGLYSYDPTDDDSKTQFTKFQGGYPTAINNTDNEETVKMTYGGYELFDNTKGAFLSNPENNKDKLRDDGFRRNIINNEYWTIAQNDLTPYRGVSGVIGGDAYIIGNSHPLHEKATYKKDESEIVEGEFSDNNTGLRIFKGQFDYDSFSKADHSYYRTWQLPCYGDYFRFEPQQNGKLTVYVKQQGVLDQKDDGTFDHMPLRYRPVFIFDEAGRTPKNTKAMTNSKVSGQWNTAMHTGTNYSKYLNSTATEALKNMCLAWMQANLVEENANSTDSHKEYWTLDGTGAYTRDDAGRKILNVRYGDRANKSQGVMNMYGKQQVGVAEPTDYHYGANTINYVALDDETDADKKFVDNIGSVESYRDQLVEQERNGDDPANGFVIISEGYVKYEFDVRAGKTYFVFAANGNLGLTSYEFNADADMSNYAMDGSNVKEYTLTYANDASMTSLLTECLVKENGEIKNGKTANVKLTRTFKNNSWSSLVLPFSVSMHQLREQFGDGVKVSHFNDISRIMNATYVDPADPTNTKTGNVDRIGIRRHVHQMIVAGVPVFIRPSFPGMDDGETISGIEFKNVTIETDEVEPVVTNMDDIVPYVGVAGSQGYIGTTHDYICTGSFYNYEVKVDEIYMNESKGLFSLREVNTAKLQGTRCKIEPVITASNPTGPVKLMLMNLVSSGNNNVGDSDGNGDDGGITTGVEYITVATEGSLDKVYNLKGQIVRSNADDLENLPQGVYIINGVKHVVK